MSKFPGGIFSKARGKTAGIVFSAARTREGKMMTSRQLVIPANPQTASQQSNRMIFDATQTIVRAWGPGIYRADFNRAVEDLPGWQSLLSLIRRQWFQETIGQYTFMDTQPPVLLGDLHFPATFSAEQVSGTETKFEWSVETGANGDPQDEVRCLVYPGEIDEDSANWIVGENLTAVRGDGDITVTHSPMSSNPARACILYFRNTANPDPDKLSIARWFQAL